ncbi:alpha/beta hydrolase [Planobispora takensis]|uniref:Calcium sensor EFh n=1 Tax=Planobispora takensis TaxID=1367882 RepID=A0A8J3WUH5_9ACTN|nr:alpha/beta hydrolase [Planobispora takensis]GII01538.1 calcium sensor EFh [Planobispora takensis]
MTAPPARHPDRSSAGSRDRPGPPEQPAARLPAPETSPGGSRLLRGVEYAAPIGFRPLLLDLYLPAGASRPAPVVVFLHGGGWQGGSRGRFGPAFDSWPQSPFDLLAGAGFAVASIDYRLSGEAVFPAQLHDGKAALRWLRAHGAGLGLDAGRVVLWGESAGGHLAALLGLTAGRPEFEGGVGVPGPSVTVAGVVDWYGPADLRTMQNQSRPDAVTAPDAPDSREARLIGAPVPQAPELAEAASPVAHVPADPPPFLLAHGTADRFVPCAQSEQLAQALRTAGGRVSLRLIEGADHLWIGPADGEALFREALEFARRLVRRVPAGTS